MTTVAPPFELRNVGAGPDRIDLDGLAAEWSFVVLLLQRDHYCPNCRRQVKSLADRYAAFVDRDAQVVSVVPEAAERVSEWQSAYDLPYPLLADPTASVGEAYGQTVRFGFLGNVSDFIGRQPAAVVIDCRGDEPTIAWSHGGRTTFDRPSVADLLEELDRL